MAAEMIANMDAAPPPPHLGWRKVVVGGMELGGVGVVREWPRVLCLDRATTGLEGR